MLREGIGHHTTLTVRYPFYKNTYTMMTMTTKHMYMYMCRKKTRKTTEPQASAVSPPEVKIVDDLMFF